MNKIPIIKKGYSGGMDFQDKNNPSTFVFLFIFFTVVALFFGVLSLRLFELTIVKGSYYKTLSDDNRIREVVIEPQRGTILDRKGTPLVTSTEANLQAEGNRLFSARHYEDPEIFAPIIGYRQVADKNDIEHDPCLNKIKSNDTFIDKVGKKGVEKLFDCDLRGNDGKKLVEVNARGKLVRSLYVVPPQNGKTVQLAIDGELQKIAYDQIKGKRAAVVALKPKTGEVLVLASTPSFNPQAFEDGDNKLLTSYFTDDDKPLFNRATEGTYPPGSTFKMVLAAGALEDKTITQDTLFEDTGFVTAGSLKFGNWEYSKSGKVEGNINIITALKKSNDVFFYKLGEKFGPEKIKEWAEKFGFDQQSNIGIDENGGSVPSPFWKQDVLKEKWYLGDTYNLSIGQGYMLATPLQVARETQAIANNGVICRPSLLKIDSDANKQLDGYQAEVCKKIPVSEKTLSIVQEGMKEACAPGGTAWPLFGFAVNDASTPTPTPDKTSTDSAKTASNSAQLAKNMRPIQLACKTGTAESHLKSGIPYAWFTVYGPTKDPEIVITVMIEEGGEGSDVAAPVAKQILKAYFERVM
jgi:penicillin-binding protein 2